MERSSTDVALSPFVRYWFNHAAIQSPAFAELRMNFNFVAPYGPVFVAATPLGHWRLPQGGRSGSCPCIPSRARSPWLKPLSPTALGKFWRLDVSRAVH